MSYEFLKHLILDEKSKISFSFKIPQSGGLQSAVVRSDRHSAFCILRSSRETLVSLSLGRVAFKIDIFTFWLPVVAKTLISQKMLLLQRAEESRHPGTPGTFSGDPPKIQ